MCSTCGCGNTDEIMISKPGKISPENVSSHAPHHNEESGPPHHHEDGHHHDHTHGHSHHPDHIQNKTVVEVEQDILAYNNKLAERNRGYFEAKNIFALNLVSSPGSGKTSLLERTLSDLKSEMPISIIEGDQQTFNDANRIQSLNVPVVQVNTGKGCHLDSDMVHRAVKELNPPEKSLLMIENVGNLVCPALFDLGENKRIVIISVAEGDDKPIKYPDMFLSSDLCIINKIDLLPYVNFNVEKTKEYATRVNHHLEFIEVSATSGEGMDHWYKWLKKQMGNE